MSTSLYTAPQTRASRCSRASLRTTGCRRTWPTASSCGRTAARRRCAAPPRRPTPGEAAGTSPRPPSRCSLGSGRSRSGLSSRQAGSRSCRAPWLSQCTCVHKASRDREAVKPYCVCCGSGGQAASGLWLWRDCAAFDALVQRRTSNREVKLARGLEEIEDVGVARRGERRLDVRDVLVRGVRAQQHRARRRVRPELKREVVEDLEVPGLPRAGVQAIDLTTPRRESSPSQGGRIGHDIG